MQSLIKDEESKVNIKIILQALAKEANELSSEALNCAMMGANHQRDHRYTNLERMRQELTDVVITYHRLMDEMAVDGFYIDDLIEQHPERMARKEAILELEMLCVKYNLGSVPRDGFGETVRYYIGMKNIKLDNDYEKRLAEYKYQSTVNRWYQAIYQHFTRFTN